MEDREIILDVESDTEGGYVGYWQNGDNGITIHADSLNELIKKVCNAVTDYFGANELPRVNLILSHDAIWNSVDPTDDDKGGEGPIGNDPIDPPDSFD